MTDYQKFMEDTICGEIDPITQRYMKIENDSSDNDIEFIDDVINILID